MRLKSPVVVSTLTFSTGDLLLSRIIRCNALLRMAFYKGVVPPVNISNEYRGQHTALEAFYKGVVPPVNISNEYRGQYTALEAFYKGVVPPVK